MSHLSEPLLKGSVPWLDRGCKLAIGLGVLVRAVDHGIVREAGEVLKRRVHLLIGALEHSAAAHGKEGVSDECDAAALHHEHARSDGSRGLDPTCSTLHTGGKTKCSCRCAVLKPSTAATHQKAHKRMHHAVRGRGGARNPPCVLKVVGDVPLCVPSHVEHLCDLVPNLDGVSLVDCGVYARNLVGLAPGADDLARGGLLECEVAPRVVVVVVRVEDMGKLPSLLLENLA